ncbi:hypothetical protein GE09DRAFT_1091423 [Coniochaeta sp. 2T2.1]|nr:hypothetical protein GE09DRAFT_1091423 [Coniochaeta sp. 2T2.1]
MKQASSHFVCHKHRSVLLSRSTYSRSRYVLDGNAMGMTATEGFKRRQPVAFGQPDSVVISYGSLEEFPVRRRTETEEQFQTRKDFFRPLRMTENCHELFDRLKASGKTRGLILKEYVGPDHAGVAASAITDGIDYFVDW